MCTDNDKQLTRKLMQKRIPTREIAKQGAQKRRNLKLHRLIYFPTHLLIQSSPSPPLPSPSLSNVWPEEKNIPSMSDMKDIGYQQFSRKTKRKDAPPLCPMKRKMLFSMIQCFRRTQGQKISFFSSFLTANLQESQGGETNEAD